MATDAKGSIASSPLELTLGSIVTDSIGSSTDVDYFKLPQVTSASKLTLDFTGLKSTTNDNEFIISVQNASGTNVATTTKGLSTTLDASIAANANYYIRVEKGTNYSADSYSIKAALTPTVETEDNGSVSATGGTADRLVPNSSFTGYLGTSSTANASDVDYYAFTTGPTDGKTVTITVAATAKDATFYKATVIDGNGQVQKDANNNPLTTTAGSSNGSLSFTVNSSGNTPKGTYYLKIEANDTSSFASSSEAKKPYTITLAGTTDFNEPPSISLGGVTSGAYGTQKDSTSAKTVSLNAEVALSSLITTSDPDTASTANSTMKSYYIGLKDTSVGDPDIISVAKTYTGSGTLTLLTGSSTTNAINNSNKGSAITITSAGNDTGITFTVLGTLADGTTGQTEVIKGVNADIATGTKLFKVVTSITASGATAANVSAGVDNSGRIVYDSDGGGTMDAAIGGETSTSTSTFFEELTAAQFATAKYVGAAQAEAGQQTIFAAVIDNSGSAVKEIKTSGLVTQQFSSKDVGITVTHANKATNLKEGTLAADIAGSSYHDLTFALPNGYSDSNNVRIVLTAKNANGSESSDLTLGGSDIANKIITLDSSDKSDTVRVSAAADGSVEGSETITLSYQVVSSNAAYDGLVVASDTFTVDEVKAKFTASALTYNATAAANTLKYDGISTAAQVNQNANLAINGDLATKAGSGFSTPHRIALTSASNDAGSSVQFKVTGTSDGSTSLVETVNAGNASTVFTNGAFKTVTEIKVLGANTQGVVSVGIASVLEEAAYSAAQAITYTITADDIPVGIDPLVVNLTSPGVTAVFDYGTKNQATSREFLVDDDKISVSANQPNGALTLVGSATASFSSPHNITVTSGGNDSSKYFWIVGTDANNDPQTVKLQGSSGSTATTTETFKTVSSITVKDGNGSSPNNVAAAGTVKAGVTDEDIAVTVTAFAAQDSTKESNPHNVTVSHAIFQNDKAATAYSKEIADISIPIQDRNLPVGADSTIQTAKSTKYTFKASDFGYSDPDGVALKKIKIMTAEAKGDLEINGADIVVSGGSANNEIALADISKLTFMPTGTEGGSGYGNFTFKVSDGLDWSTSANTMNVNVGDSVQTTINYYAQNTSGTAANQAIKSATIVMKDSGGNAAYTGVYATNTSGVADFTGVSGGDYTLSFAVTDTVGDAAINMSDVSKALAIATLNATPTTDQKVAMDVNGDGKTNMSDVSAVLGMAVNLNDTGAGALRNTAVSDQYATKIVAISAGTNLTLDAYLLGDLDGSYANILAAG